MDDNQSPINSLAGRLGFAEDKEYGRAAYAIRLYVNQINAAGGINGRKINPIIVTFDPTEHGLGARAVRAMDPGSPPVFAVVDGIGTWEGTTSSV